MSRKNTKESFEAKIEKTETCWNWLGSVNNSGYGFIRWHGERYGVHRLSYELFIGNIPDGLFALHKCDNRKCVNPDHLWLGTQSDNLKDMYNKGREGNRYKWTTENNPNKGKPMSDKNKALMSERKRKSFRVIDPDGQIIEGINLTQFCKDRGLNQGAMWSVMAGKVPSHKGYTKPS